MMGKFRDEQLTRIDHWIAGWWLLNLVLFLHVVLLDPPLWVTYFYNVFLYGIGALISYYSKLVRKIFVLATIAGILELGVDHFLVSVTGTLVYPTSLPMLLSSPVYMPLSWAIVTTQLGYLAVRLARIGGRYVAAIGPSLLAMSLIGFYEYGAFKAGIWEYVSAPLYMLGHVPLYVVIAEGLMFATLYEFVRLERPVLAGFGFAVVISVCYAGTFYVFAIAGAILS